jgi:hypothetical protein
MTWSIMASASIGTTEGPALPTSEPTRRRDGLEVLVDAGLGGTEEIFMNSTL